MINQDIVCSLWTKAKDGTEDLKSFSSSFQMLPFII